MSAVISEAREQETQRAPAGRLLSAIELADCKIAYTLRRVPESDLRRVIHSPAAPSPGDVVLGRVQRVGQHSGLQLRSGRRATLFEGDLIMVAYGNRYATDQYEGAVPGDLGSCDLIAAGGVAAHMVNAHRKMRAPTRLEPLGLVADESGKPLNLHRYALKADATPRTALPVLAVTGSAMNAGKTTAASHLVRGLKLAGLRVGAAKLTGTGSCGDTALMKDAGAAVVVDFTDAGLASTYRCDLSELLRAAVAQLDYLAGQSLDVAVIELADGLLQRETAALLDHPALKQRITGVIFAGNDALGALAGVQFLEQRGLAVLAVAGALTASPLATREAAAVLHVPIHGLEALANAGVASTLLRSATSTRPAVRK